MTRRSEITYMQVRLARLASERWRRPIGEVGRIFARYRVFEYIRDGYDAFHVEGDEAVWEELQPYLRSRGCSLA